MKIKCLSVNPPWAEEIIFGEKDIENRKWQTKYRGPVAIHETKNGGGSGAIIGLANIIDCVDKSNSPYFYGPYGFVLDNRRPIIPIVTKGKLRLFDVDIPDDIFYGFK